MNLFQEIMYHKEIDHNTSHSTWGNQFLHLISSIMMIGAVYSFFYNSVDLCSKIVIVSQILRQSGHFFIEGNVSNNEIEKIGYNTDMKITAVCLMISIRTLYYMHGTVDSLFDIKYMFTCYCISICYRILYLTFFGKHSLQGLVWLLKITTDIFTDIPLYGCTVFGKTVPTTYNYIWLKRN